MWGKLLPKKVQPKFPCTSFGREICDFLVGEDDTIIDIIQYPYADLDWRECQNILFTQDEQRDDRATIILMFC